MAEKTRLLSEDMPEKIPVVVQCRRRPRYVRAGITFQFGRNAVWITHAQLTTLIADKNLTVQVAQTGTTDGQATVAPVDLGGVSPETSGDVALVTSSGEALTSKNNVSTELLPDTTIVAETPELLPDTTIVAETPELLPDTTNTMNKTKGNKGK